MRYAGIVWRGFWCEKYFQEQTVLFREEHNELKLVNAILEKWHFKDILIRVSNYLCENTFGQVHFHKHLRKIFSRGRRLLNTPGYQIRITKYIIYLYKYLNIYNFDVIRLPAISISGQESRNLAKSLIVVSEQGNTDKINFFIVKQNDCFNNFNLFSSVAKRIFIWLQNR